VINVDPVLFEKIIIKLIFTNTELCDRILPYLVREVFTDLYCTNIVDIVIDYNAKNNDVPSVKDMSLLIANKETYDRLTECININTSEYNNDLLMEKTEEWFARLREGYTDAKSEKKRENLMGTYRNFVKIFPFLITPWFANDMKKIAATCNKGSLQYSYAMSILETVGKYHKSFLSKNTETKAVIPNPRGQGTLTL